MVNFFNTVQTALEQNSPIDFQDIAKQVAKALPQWDIDANAFQFKDKNGDPVYYIFDIIQADDMFTVLNAFNQDTVDNNSTSNTADIADTSATNNTADIADTSVTNNTDLSLLDVIQRYNSNSFVESPRRGLTELENKTVDAIMAIANRYGKTEIQSYEHAALADADHARSSRSSGRHLQPHQRHDCSYQCCQAAGCHHCRSAAGRRAQYCRTSRS